jgi:hypothetical protein
MRATPRDAKAKGGHCVHHACRCLPTRSHLRRHAVLRTSHTRLATPNVETYAARIGRAQLLGNSDVMDTPEGVDMLLAEANCLVSTHLRPAEV